MVPVSPIVGVPSTPLKTQPDKLTGLEPGFHNSIHSSLDEAAVPAQAISLMTTLRNPTGVGVRVIVDVWDAVNVMVGDNVLVGVNVWVGIFVAVGVTVAVKANVTEFCCLGVPFIGSGVGVLLSNPFLTAPLFDAHADGPSASTSMRSML